MLEIMDMVQSGRSWVKLDQATESGRSAKVNGPEIKKWTVRMEKTGQFKGRKLRAEIRQPKRLEVEST